MSWSMVLEYSGKLAVIRQWPSQCNPRCIQHLEIPKVGCARAQELPFQCGQNSGKGALLRQRPSLCSPWYIQNMDIPKMGCTRAREFPIQCSLNQMLGLEC